MKKIVTSILGVSLLAGAVYAAGSHKMGNMNGMHSKMSKEDCLAMHKEFHSEKKSKVNKSALSEEILNKIYPPSLDD